MRKRSTVWLIGLMAMAMGIMGPIRVGVAKNPKPGVYNEKQMEGMTEKAKESGQLIFIQISATWCPPCAETIKKMQKIVDKYPGTTTYIVVEVGVTPAEMAEYAKKYPDTVFVEIPGADPPKGFPARAYPTLYVFNGTKYVPVVGVPSAAMLKQWEEAMKKAAKAAASSSFSPASNIQVSALGHLDSRQNKHPLSMMQEGCFLGSLPTGR